MEEKRVTIKKCDDCGAVMINNCELEGQLHFEHGIDSKSTLKVKVPTGEKSNFLGMNVDVTKSYRLKARMCPNCGKVDLYADIPNVR